MKLKLAAIIPVATFESEKTLVQSVKNLKNLEIDKDWEFKILYVVDLKNKLDKRGVMLRELGVEVLERNTTRGKRAGAINDGLKFLEEINYNPDYIAIFDVDSKPAKNFLKENIKMLKLSKKAYISSSPRYISNPVNFVSKTVWLEYFLLNYMVKKGGYKQFNGLIGVLKSKFIYKYKLNEDAITEDADFSTRMHLMGYKGIYCESSFILEQSPIYWRELYNQRKRWYYGGLQLWRYWKNVKKCKNKEFKYTWILALTLTYLPILMLPFLALAPFLILLKFKKPKKVLLTFGLIIHTFVLQAASISAIANFISKKGVEWKPSKRC